MDEFSLHMLGLGPRGPRRQQNTCSGDQVRDLDQRHAGWGGGSLLYHKRTAQASHVQVYFKCRF